MRARWIFLGLIALLVISAVLFRNFRAVEVATATVTTGDAVEVVYATGFVEVEQPVEMSARVTAPIVEVRVNEGERVSRGQVLAVLDAADQRAQIAQLAAQTRWAEVEARRTLSLVDKGFASKAARDRVTTNLAGARAAESAARDRLENFVLRASINGVVLRRDAEPGDMASPSRTLLVIGDPALTKITATIDERDIARIAVGQDVVMSTDAYPGRLFKARVREITLGGDPQQRAFRARLQPLDAGALPVGLTLEVNIVTGRKSGVLLVPEAAIVEGHAFVVRDGRAHRIAVKTGIEGPDRVEVTAGLAAGDEVIVDPSDGLEDGARVRAATR